MAIDRPRAIVGVGASAGGLPAFTEMLSHLPEHSGLAVVFIQHMDPDHESQMPALLSRVTPMPVAEAKEGMLVQADHVYVIPANADLKISEGVLHLVKRQKNLKPPYHLPIDVFFKSLAEDQKEKAIGVVLSGTGSDGAVGLLQIQSEGGMAMVQDENSAQYPDMPRAAIAMTNVDYILPSQAIAQELVCLAQSPLLSQPMQGMKMDLFSGHSKLLAEIFGILKRETGTDFSHYKPNTIQRRILRRMIVRRVSSLADYLKVLQADASEVQRLRQEMLIHVTRFFRDPENFDFIKAKVFPEIFKDKSIENPLRLWVPGCSSGEEVYSLAICLLEALTENELKFPIQIFGSDISEQVLEKARKGFYDESDLAGLSAERIKRFFVRVGGRYQVSKAIRELCVFAKQDLTRDPPFSKIDLISCRNLLIYLDAGLQAKVFSVFHYSLKPNGFLVLGTAETVGGFSNLFVAIDKKHRVYSKKFASAELPLDLIRSAKEKSALSASHVTQHREKFDLEKAVNRMMVDKCVPAGVVINEDMTIIRFQGHMQPYLDPSTGGASFNLLKMVLNDLVADLRIAINEAIKTNHDVKKTGVAILQDGKERFVNIQVLPFAHPETREKYFIVLFTEEKIVAARVMTSKQRAAQVKHKDESLKVELETTKKELQAIIESSETTNQELRAANEEILSSNEELQSANEELETAKEELQSTNEELATMNEELTNRNTQLSQVHADLNNLFINADLPMIMLHSDLRIRNFTPMAEAVMNLKLGDEGRSIFDFKLNIDVPDLESLLLSSMSTGEVKEREVKDQNGIWYLLKIRPYRTVEKKIEGVVIVLVNIHALRTAMERLIAAHDFSETIIQSILNPILVLDDHMRVSRANEAFCNLFQVTQEETLSRSLYELGKGEWNLPELRTLLETELPQKGRFTNFEMNCDFEKVGPKSLLLNAADTDLQGRGKMILLSIQDITQHKIDAEVLRDSAEVARLGKIRQQFAAMTSHELRTPLTAIKEGIGLVLEEFAGPLNDEQKENLRISQNNVDRLSRLINNMLDLTRMDAGHFKVFLSPTDLKALVHEVCHLMKQVSAMKKISLTIDEPDEDVQAVCDPDKIKQVIINLIDNAIKFTGPGGQVQIRLRHENGKIFFYIIDNGMGIKEEDQKKIFELFQQSHLGKTQKGSGFGIGLTVCKKIMEQHQGQITVRSTYGKGSEFTVSYPDNLIPSPSGASS